MSELIIKCITCGNKMGDEEVTYMKDMDVPRHEWECFLCDTESDE